MNLKSFFIGATVGVLVVGGTFFCANLKKDNKKEESLVNSDLSERENMEYTKKGVLEILDYEKKYQEEFDTQNYEVVIKNTSGERLRKVEFTLGENVYELYDMLPDEEYKFVAYSNENTISLKVISVDYEIRNYNEDEIDIDITNDGKKVSGSLKNNGDRELYPTQIIYFLYDGNGHTIQKTIEYAGCFDEGLVIKPENTLEFEEDIDEGYSFYNTKSVIVRYSDLEFKTTETKIFE